MAEKAYNKLPPMVWLRVTDFMIGWLEHELGGAVRVKGRQVVSVQHLPGARDALRMETADDMLLDPKTDLSRAMSATRYNVIDAGLRIDAPTVERLYGVTREQLSLYLPIECPRMALTRGGVLRPWTADVSFGVKQVGALMKVIRDAFWLGVGDYNRDYARLLDGQPYPAIDMIEAFCRETHTPDICVEPMRREWQRRVKNGQS